MPCGAFAYVLLLPVFVASVEWADLLEVLTIPVNLQKIRNSENCEILREFHQKFEIQTQNLRKTEFPNFRISMPACSRSSSGVSQLFEKFLGSFITNSDIPAQKLRIVELRISKSECPKLPNF